MQTKFFYYRKVRYNMTLKEVSNRTGIPLVSIIKYDNGEVLIENASYKRVKLLSQLFNCSTDDLIGYIE